MKAWSSTTYGAPETVLRLTDVDAPVPADGEVLISVRAAAVNALDWHLLRGDPYLVRIERGLRRPRAPSVRAPTSPEWWRRSVRL